jgi:phosphoglycerate dehydrogenase-like enzyme
MIEALRSGHIRQAGPDVLAIEPLLASSILTTMASASPGWCSNLVSGRNCLI